MSFVHLGLLARALPAAEGSAYFYADFPHCCFLERCSSPCVSILGQVMNFLKVSQFHATGPEELFLKVGLNRVYSYELLWKSKSSNLETLYITQNQIRFISPSKKLRTLVLGVT